MQSDARFVENIQHTDQARTDLRRQANALRFAAGKRTRRSIEREVRQADVLQKAQPFANLFEHLIGDEPLTLSELKRFKEPHRLCNRKRRHFRNVLAADRKSQTFGPQARSVAVLARSNGHVLLDFTARPFRLHLTQTPLEARDHAFEMCR